MGFAAGAAWGSNFYPRPPRGGRRTQGAVSGFGKYFYPRPPRGGRRGRCGLRRGVDQFLSTPSARRATGELQFKGDSVFYFYPRPPRGGRPPARPLQPRLPDFYPRPPRGGRPSAAFSARFRSLFLSTPSARRATKRNTKGGRENEISIHALREEGDDLGMGGSYYAQVVFLSTPSARRATKQTRWTAQSSCISIHALREEGDQPVRHAGHHSGKFLSTPSARRATQYTHVRISNTKISIHALREEGDRSPRATTAHGCDFYPRPPRGGRPFKAGQRW